MQAMTPITPLEAGGEMFSRAKTQSIFLPRTSMARPLSEATEIFDTDMSESEFEGEEIGHAGQPPSPKGSFDSDDSRRRSQTTLSSYEEIPTPSSNSGRSQRRPFELQLRPTEGPKGPHLFRASQISTDSSLDYALQMSPLQALFPKQPPPRTETAFSQDTVTPIAQQQQYGFSIDTIMSQPPEFLSGAESEIRKWNPTQVIDWMVDSGMEESIIECFELHDISGAVLMDLDFEDLKELGIQSFGKRHQLWNAISALQGRDGSISPQPTPFQDISRPCTTATNRRSPSRGRDVCETPIDGDQTPIEPGQGKKRRGRKMPKALDVITPMESVSIVAIEQLLPKPHKCAKGERCAKYRKQQRELQQLNDENGIGRFPISPTKGGRIFVHGDPGNAWTAENIVPRDVERQNEVVEIDEPLGTAMTMPSLVASSAALGQSQMPAFELNSGMLDHLDKRDPQDNVRQFLNFQHLQTPSPPLEEHYLDGTLTPVERPATAPPQQMQQQQQPLDLFPDEHIQAFQYQQPPLQLPQQTQNPHLQLRSLPKLAIPRSASAAPNLHTLKSPETLRSATASPGGIYRFGTPASEMDVPLTAFPSNLPPARDASQSVPPSMQFRDPQPLARSASSSSRAPHWHRPSFALPSVQENEVLSPSTSSNPRPSISSSRTTSSDRIPDPAHHSPQQQTWGSSTYGPAVSHAGFMRKRKTKMLRHEWSESHFRLTGTSLAMHANARLSSTALDTIDVDNYAVACATAPSSSKLSAAFKSLSLKTDDKAKAKADAVPFAFQLVPAGRENAKAALASTGGNKTHHFAVKTKDERIDWMRELMLAKALQQKGKGYEVEVYGSGPA